MTLFRTLEASDRVLITVKIRSKEPVLRSLILGECSANGETISKLGL